MQSAKITGNLWFKVKAVKHNQQQTAMGDSKVTTTTMGIGGKRV